ncbi:MAG: nuclear transport factor 2 family protein [Ignavibacteria bacterium]|nr:nuclear transport factor 2 family protein [Ignavibacteria bacterium]
MKNREEIINNYIEGYNSFNVSKMMKDLSDEIVFENIQNGETTMTLNGIDEFKTQAEIAKNYFSVRQQKIKSFWHEKEKCEIEIEYFGVLAIDFPNGMKKGGEIKLNGKSIFEFNDEKIIRLTDIS